MSDQNEIEYILPDIDPLNDYETIVLDDETLKKYALNIDENKIDFLDEIEFISMLRDE